MNTSPNDFVLWYDALMQSAPEGYLPWLFPVKANGKDPDALAISKRATAQKSPCCNAEWIRTKRFQFYKTICGNCGQGKGSWKAPWARLWKPEAIQRLKQGDNIGIAARANDPLVIIDRDSLEAEAPKKQTLTNKSRKRNGFHYFFFTTDPRCKTLFATESLGEIRSSEAYVVCAGSYCEMNMEEIEKLPEQEKPMAGKYSCEIPLPPTTIIWEEMPKHFIDAFNKCEEIKKKEDSIKKDFIAKQRGKQSALYNIRMGDLVVNHQPRFPHPIHGSKETGANFSLSDDGAVCTCWRHNRSLNAIHFLAVKSGKFNCDTVGKALRFKDGNSTKSTGCDYSITDEMIFWAWHEAKQMGVIPIEDPVPSRGLNYLAKTHGVYSLKPNEKKLPYWAYNKILTILECEY
jgi:hypothetical protein